MGSLATVALVVLSIAAMTFVVFFGRLPVFRRTPVAWLHRLVVVHVPSAVLGVDRVVTGGRSTTALRRFGSFLINDRHPTVLIFYIALLAVSEYLAVPMAWPLLDTATRAILAILIILPYIFLYMAAASDPGAVTLATLPAHLRRYPYDYALFHPGARCRTCDLLKPPRSKHCSVCKRCVGRLDHHCIFINNCVGVGNHRWFLLLLLTTAALASFGGLIGLQLISERIRAERYATFSLLPWRATVAPTAVFGDMPVLPPQSKPQRLSQTDYVVLLLWGLHTYLPLGSVSMLGLLLSPLVWGLLAFNGWNVYTGQTTNESLKWSDWRNDIQDGFVYCRRLSPERRGQGNDLARPSASTRWPVEPQHVLVRTDDGKPPPTTSDRFLPGVGAWEHVWTLRDVANVYDLGFWNNLVDVFYPDYDFNSNRGLPSVERRGRPRKRLARP